MPSTPSPPELPRIFVDRSLGAIEVPAILRGHGLDLITMREHYGEQNAQGVADHEWIALVAQQNWIGLHKDAHIRRRALEQASVMETGARMFCVADANLTAADAAQWILNNLNRIAQAAAQPGPYIYAIYSHRINRVLP